MPRLVRRARRLMVSPLTPTHTLPPLDSASYARLSALQRACHDPITLLAALDSGMDPNQHFDFNHQSRPLLAAIDAKPWNSQMVHILLARGADPNIHDHPDRTAIKNALGHAHHLGEAFEIASLLAQHPTLRAAPEDSLLSISFYAPSLVRALVDRGFDPNALDKETTLFLIGSPIRRLARPTCLGRCASFGTPSDADAVRALVACGADPNDDRGGVSPLAMALLGSGCPDGILALLEAGADPLWSGFGGMDCLAIARARFDSDKGTYLEVLRAQTLDRVELHHRLHTERLALSSCVALGRPSQDRSSI
jgi:hypothetical protein